MLLVVMIGDPRGHALACDDLFEQVEPTFIGGHWQTPSLVSIAPMVRGAANYKDINAHLLTVLTRHVDGSLAAVSEGRASIRNPEAIEGRIARLQMKWGEARNPAAIESLIAHKVLLASMSDGIPVEHRFGGQMLCESVYFISLDGRRNVFWFVEYPSSDLWMASCAYAVLLRAQGIAVKKDRLQSDAWQGVAKILMVSGDARRLVESELRALASAKSPEVRVRSTKVLTDTCRALR